MFKPEEEKLLKSLGYHHLFSKESVTVFLDEKLNMHFTSSCNEMFLDIKAPRMALVPLCETSLNCECFFGLGLSDSLLSERYEMKIAFKELSGVEKGRRQIKALYKNPSYFNFLKAYKSFNEFRALYSSPGAMSNHLDSLVITRRKEAETAFQELSFQSLVRKFLSEKVEKELKDLYKSNDPSFEKILNGLLRSWALMVQKACPLEKRRKLAFKKMRQAAGRSSEHLATKFSLKVIFLTTEMWLQDAEYLYQKYEKELLAAPKRILLYGSNRSYIGATSNYFPASYLSLKASRNCSLLALPVELQRFLEEIGVYAFRCSDEFFSDSEIELAVSLWDFEEDSEFSDLSRLTNVVKCFRFDSYV